MAKNKNEHFEVPAFLPKIPHNLCFHFLCLQSYCFGVTELLAICINTYCADSNCLSYKKILPPENKVVIFDYNEYSNRGSVNPCSAIALLLLPYCLHNSRFSFDSETRLCVGTETNLIQLVRARKSLPNLTQQQAISIPLPPPLS